MVRWNLEGAKLSMKSLEIGVGVSQAKDTLASVQEAVSKAKLGLTVTPGLALVTTTVEHEREPFLAAVRAALPDIAVSGITTSLGILGTSGVVSSANGVVGVMLFASPDGSVQFGAASASATDNVGEAAAAAASRIQMQQPGKTPSVLLVTPTPGAEEDVLAGIARVFPGVPAYGGSAADHAIQGEWSAFGNDGVHTNGVAIAAVFGNVKVGGAFVSPYSVTATEAVVTESDGRTIQKLDGRPAATVLGEWVGESISDQVQSGGVVLAQTALSPLAIRRKAGTRTHHIPTHPFQIVQPGGAVRVFTKPAQGDVICLLEGSVEALTGHLQNLVAEALSSGSMSKRDVTGGFLIYCAGCAAAVGAELDNALRTHLQSALGEVPLLGLCTFGEQGFVPELGNAHHNLSLSLVLFGSRES